MEFRRRVVAGLALYGLELKHLPEVLSPYGDIPKHHVARMGRGGDGLDPGSSTALALAKALGLPDGWFGAEDWSTLVEGAEYQPRLGEIGDRVAAEKAASRAKQKESRRSAQARSSKAKKRRAG